VHTEALVEAALARVLARSTALIVVHRPSTVALADRVALLQGGVITHVGTHSELLASVPAYRAVLSAEAEHDDSPALDDAGDLARRRPRGGTDDAHAGSDRHGPKRHSTTHAVTDPTSDFDVTDAIHVH
jgi:ABC-type multidrug transport system, ATPase and permease components